MLRQKQQQLGLATLFVPQQIADVGPIEAGEEHLALLQLQPLTNIDLGARVGGGGEGQPWHLGKALRQLIELAVFRAEIVPPLRHAMGFIDGEQGQRCGSQPLQQITAQQPLRRHVKQIQLPVAQLPPHLLAFACLQAGMQGGGSNPELLQGLHLVLHQGDQWGDHHRQPSAA